MRYRERNRRFCRASAALLILILLGVAPMGAGAKPGRQQAQTSGAAQKPQEKPATIQEKPAEVREKTPRAKPPGPGEYAGSEVCGVCHEQARAAAFPYHIQLETNQRFGWTGRGCEACHGPAKAHAESGGNEPVLSFKTATALRTAQACLNCHSQAFWRGSAHETSNASCVSCHSVHLAKSVEKLLAKRTETETCLSCHTTLRKTQFQRSTHLFRDEWRNARMSCTDCHSPHGSQAPKMVRANSANEMCYSCHAEKRGPFLWAHSPAQENCLTCHSPHGSNNASLLVMRTTQLCQSCHMQGRHQTVAGRPNSAWIFNRSCLNCHPQIHGSNHPSGVNLQR